MMAVACAPKKKVIDGVDRSTGEAVVVTIEAVGRADSKLAQAQPIVEKMTPASLPADKATVGTLMSGARGDLKDATATGKQAVEKAATDNKTITDQAAKITTLQSNDPVLKWLRITAYGCFALAVLCIVAVVLASFNAAVGAVLSGWRIGLTVLAGIFALAGSCFLAIVTYERVFIRIGLWTIGTVAACAVLFGLLMIWKWWKANKDLFAHKTALTAVVTAVEAAPATVGDLIKVGVTKAANGSGDLVKSTISDIKAGL